MDLHLESEDNRVSAEVKFPPHANLSRICMKSRTIGCYGYSSRYRLDSEIYFLNLLDLFGAKPKTLALSFEKHILIILYIYTYTYTIYNIQYTMYNVQCTMYNIHIYIYHIYVYIYTYYILNIYNIVKISTLQGGRTFALIKRRDDGLFWSEMGGSWTKSHLWKQQTLGSSYQCKCRWGWFAWLVNTSKSTGLCKSRGTKRGRLFQTESNYQKRNFGGLANKETTKSKVIKTNLCWVGGGVGINPYIIPWKLPYSLEPKSKAVHPKICKKNVTYC